MKALSVTEGRRAQEYLASGAVITAAGVMFMAGSLQLTKTSLMFARWLAIGLAVAGVFLMGAGLGMKARSTTMAMASTVKKPQKPMAAKAKTTAKAGSSTKRSGRKK
jgi:sulfite exporter TauE/SafE